MNAISEILRMPNRTDAYIRLVRLFLYLPKCERDEIKSSWDFGVEWTFPDPHRLTCTVGEKYSCYQRIEASLAYHAIAERSVVDLRDVLMAISLDYHSCQLAGIDSNKLFERIAYYINDDEIAESIRSFPKRKEADRSLHSFTLEKRINSMNEIELWHKCYDNQLSLEEIERTFGK